MTYNFSDDPRSTLYVCARDKDVPSFGICCAISCKLSLSTHVFVHKVSVFFVCVTCLANSLRPCYVANILLHNKFNQCYEEDTGRKCVLWALCANFVGVWSGNIAAFKLNGCLGHNLIANLLMFARNCAHPHTREHDRRPRTAKGRRSNCEVGSELSVRCDDVGIVRTVGELFWRTSHTSECTHRNQSVDGCALCVYSIQCPPSDKRQHWFSMGSIFPMPDTAVAIIKFYLSL